MIDGKAIEEATRKRMADFARLVNREVCIRGFGHAPTTAAERRQRHDGPVNPLDLDCVNDMRARLLPEGDGFDDVCNAEREAGGQVIGNRYIDDEDPYYR